MNYREPSKELLCAIIKNRGCHKLVDRCFDVSSYEMKCSECPISYINLGIERVNSTDDNIRKVKCVTEYYIERYGIEEFFEVLL